MRNGGLPALAGAHVDAKRLVERQRHMDRLGATPAGGVHRLALSDADLEARRLLTDWAQARGFAAEIDPVGNMFFTRPGLDRDATPVIAGSHTDSQPYAGRFDGMFGVLAAFEALEAIDDAGLATCRPIIVVNWTGEEGGARFPVGTIGSAAFTGRRSLAETLALSDPAGTSLAEALEAASGTFADLGRRPLGAPVHAFVEPHIEQGPILEQAGVPIGVVTAIQGMRRFAVEVTGEEAHSGTTQRAIRKDALQDALGLIAEMRELCCDDADAVRFTVGRLEVRPNAPAVVPGSVRFVIDLRHPDRAVLDELTAGLEERCRMHDGPCSVAFSELTRIEPVTFKPKMPDLVERSARCLSIPSMRLISGANHDASHLARICQTTMIFIPCKGGISHNEAESAADEDLVAGARVLCQTIFELAQE